MKKIFIDYIKIIGFSITGIVFGMTFFIIFINFYHYKDVNSIYIKNESDFKMNERIINKLSIIKENINYFDVNSYNGVEDVYSLASIKSRINTCIEKINTSEFNELLSKDKINIKDVYNMQQFYQINISNECLVKQLYEITSDDTKIKINDMQSVNLFMRDNIDSLIKSSNYLQKVIKSNSDYSFVSNSSKRDIYDVTKDSYYELLNNYNESIDYIYDVSLWFKEVSK